MGLVALLVVGGAAEVLPVSLNCPLPLRRTHSPTLVCCFCVFAAMGVTSTKSGRLEVNLSLGSDDYDHQFSLVKMSKCCQKSCYYSPGRF